MEKSKIYLLSLATFLRQYQVPPLMEGHSDGEIFLTMLTPGLCGEGNPAQSHITKLFLRVQQHSHCTVLRTLAQG